MRRSSAFDSSRIAFTAVISERLFRHPTGEFVEEIRWTHAVRHDGSMVRRRDVSARDGRLYAQRILLDVPGGKRVSIDGLTDSLTTIKVSTKDPGRWGPWTKSECAPPASARRAVIAGYESFEWVHRKPLGRDGEMRVESWLATGLDCFPVKETSFLNKPGQPEVMTAIREVLSITSGAPDPALFTIPQNYVERSPSEVFAEHARRYGKECANCGRTNQLLDDIYRRKK